MTSKSIKILEDTLGENFLESKGVQEEEKGNHYALTADPEFDSIQITSVSLPWNDYMLTTEITIYPRNKGSKITDDTTDTEPKCSEMKSLGGLTADVLIFVHHTHCTALGRSPV